MAIQSVPIGVLNPNVRRNVPTEQAANKSAHEVSKLFGGGDEC